MMTTTESDLPEAGESEYRLTLRGLPVDNDTIAHVSVIFTDGGEKGCGLVEFSIDGRQRDENNPDEWVGVWESNFDLLVRQAEALRDFLSLFLAKVS